jgi:hypothetical protein
MSKNVRKAEDKTEGDLDIDRMIILKWDLNKDAARLWIRLIWLLKGSNIWLL